MKKLFSTRVSDSTLSLALLVLRLGFGGLLAYNHGWDKLNHFNDYVAKTQPMFGMAPNVVMGLLVFAEFFCSLFVILGVATRLATVPVIIAMSVAFFKAHGASLKEGELALVFLIAFFTILIAGPGKISVDRSISRA